MKSRIILSTLLAALMGAGGAATLEASSHREAPLISEDPTADNTDVYAWVAADSPDMVTLVANYIPFEAPAGGPNFHNFSDSAIYEIHIDNNGDAVEDITYQFRFRTEVRNPLSTFLYNTGQVTSLDDSDLNVRQFYTITRIDGDRRTGNRSAIGEFQVAPANIGPRSTPDYETNLGSKAVGTLTNGGKVFAGPRDDPFFVDLGSIFDLLALRPVQGLHAIPTPGNTTGVDALKGMNVHTIALQLPKTVLTRDGRTPDAGNGIVGVWATASRPRITLRSAGTPNIQTFNGFSQVSRLGMPLVNEVVIPRGLKDIFNASEPKGDFPLFQSNELFRNRILKPEVATLMKALYGIDVPTTDRNDLVSVFLTGVDGLNKPANVVPADMLRINLTTMPSTSANRLGVIAGDNAGFPNGRRPGDDVIDVALRVVAGVLVEGFNKAPNNALTDGVDSNDVAFMSRFPYLAAPHQGYDYRAGQN